jgi:hypothetical protein
MPLVGILAQNSPLWEHFRQGLCDLGYVEGRTIVIEYRWGEGSDVLWNRANPLHDGLVQESKDTASQLRADHLIE